VGRRSPRRGVSVRVFDREREREPAVRKRDGVEPVTELGRLRCRDGANFGKDLEGVQRRSRLAFGCAQVWLQAMSVASVRVAVCTECCENRLRVPVVEEQLEPPPIEEPGMAGHEPAGGGHIRAHSI
jgi:hypothetical protein